MDVTPGTSGADININGSMDVNIDVIKKWLYSEIIDNLDKVIKNLLFRCNVNDDKILLIQEFWSCSQTLDNDYTSIWLGYYSTLKEQETDKRIDIDITVTPLPLKVIVIEVNRIFQLHRDYYSKEAIIEILDQLSANGMKISEVKIENKRNDWICNWYSEKFDKLIKRVLKLTYLGHREKYVIANNGMPYNFRILFDLCCINNNDQLKNQILEEETKLIILKFVASNKDLIKGIENIFTEDIPLPEVYVVSSEHLSTTDLDASNIGKRWDELLNYLNHSRLSEERRSGVIKEFKERLKKESIKYFHYTRDQEVLLLQLYKEDKNNYIRNFRSQHPTFDEISVKTKLKRLCINCFVYAFMDMDPDVRGKIEVKAKIETIGLLKDMVENGNFFEHDSDVIANAAYKYVTDNIISDNAFNIFYSRKKIMTYVRTHHTDTVKALVETLTDSGTHIPKKQVLEKSSDEGDKVTKGREGDKETKGRVTKRKINSNNDSDYDSNYKDDKDKTECKSKGGRCASEKVDNDRADSGYYNSKGAEELARSSETSNNPLISLRFPAPKNTVVEPFVDDSTNYSIRVTVNGRCFIMNESDFAKNPSWIEQTRPDASIYTNLEELLDKSWFGLKIIWHLLILILVL